MSNLELRLTAKEITELLKEALVLKGYNLTSACFNIAGEEMEGDIFSQHPLQHKLSGAVCIVQKIPH